MPLGLVHIRSESRLKVDIIKESLLQKICEPLLDESNKFSDIDDAFIIDNSIKKDAINSNNDNFFLWMRIISIYDITISHYYIFKFKKIFSAPRMDVQLSSHLVQLYWYVTLSLSLDSEKTLGMAGCKD
jgi:hypothetical protein